MMFAHHFFTFPTWWTDGINYPFIRNLAPYFCDPLKLCVPVFCFLTGYFYFYNKDKSYLYSARKITDILIDYWCVLLLLAVLSAITIHYVYTPVGFLKEMFALERPTMVFCWYVCFYYTFMLLLPLLTKLLSKGVHRDLFFSTILFPTFIWIIRYIIIKHGAGKTIVNILWYFAWWFPAVLVGYIFANYNIFDRMEYNSKNTCSKKKAVFLWVIVGLCVPMGRYFLPSFSLNIGSLPIFHESMIIKLSLDFVYAPVFIYCLVNLCRAIKWVHMQFILKEVGKNSLMMWFVSCIFFNNSKKVFQPILYCPHNPVLVLIWGLCVCYIISALLNFGLHTIKKQKNKILFHKV